MDAMEEVLLSRFIPSISVAAFSVETSSTTADSDETDSAFLIVGDAGAAWEEAVDVARLLFCE